MSDESEEENYIVIACDQAFIVVKEVNRCISKGYIPIGGLTSRTIKDTTGTGPVFYQAMIRKEIKQ